MHGDDYHPPCPQVTHALAVLEARGVAAPGSDGEVSWLELGLFRARTLAEGLLLDARSDIDRVHVDYSANSGSRSSNTGGTGGGFDPRSNEALLQDIINAVDALDTVTYAPTHSHATYAGPH